MAGHEVVRKVLTLRQWQTIDAILDNVASNEQVDGDPATAERARRLREAGWAVSRSHPQAGLGVGGWPPADSPFEIALAADDWEFVRTAVAHGNEISRTLRDDARLDARSRQEQAASVAFGEDALSAL